MTTIAETGERVELNPDVPYPPFSLWLRLPGAWSRLDSNPGTWRRSAQEFIDTTLRGSRLTSPERRDVLGVLEGLVADCQRAGAALSLLTVGRRAAGGAASFGMHCAFASDGRAASVGRVHDILPRSGIATGLDTAAGPGVVHRDRVTMVVPGTAALVALTSVQIFVPLPGTAWTVVLSTASAHPELTDSLEQTLLAVAASIRTDDPAGEDPAGSTDRPAGGSSGAAGGSSGSAGSRVGGPGGGPGGRPGGGAGGSAGSAGGGCGGSGAQSVGDPAATWAPAGSPAAPGFERGFGTLVQRRIDPPADPGADR